MTINVKDLIRKASDDSNEIIPSLTECIEHVKNDFQVDEEDAVNLMNMIKDMVGICDGTVYILQLIADIAKLESNRPLFTDRSLMLKIIEYLMSDYPDICVQSIRSLANICADNGDACGLFMECGGVEKIIDKFTYISSSKDKVWIQIIPNTAACIRNMIINNDAMQEKFLTNNALPILWRCVENYYETDPTIATCAISGIEVLADSDGGLQKLEESKILEGMCVLMRTCDDDLLHVMLTEMLTEYGGKENTRILLCRCGYVETICELIEERANFKEAKCTDDILKEMADLVVMLTSGEESFTILQQKEKQLLNRISSWIASPNPHIQVSAGLVLGNYARSEATCNEIVANEIHENLINVMKEHLDDESYYDRFQAYGSCLKNLTIPEENKSVLIDAGLHLLAVELVKKPSLGVQFKGLGIIRLLIQGNGPITTPLMSDVELMSKICELSEVSCVTSVPSEAQRLMSALFKYNNSEGPIRNAISLGGFKPVLTLLSSEHTLMQNEGLVGLIIAIASVSDCLPHLTENEALPKVMKLITSPNVNTQTIFNCITLLQAISSLDGGMEALKSHQVVDILESIKTHNEEIIRNKVVETLDLIKL